jgi:hypothetical protein
VTDKKEDTKVGLDLTLLLECSEVAPIDFEKFGRSAGQIIARYATPLQTARTDPDAIRP